MTVVLVSLKLWHHPTPELGQHTIVQGATFRIKAPIKTTSPRIANLEAIKITYKGIFQTHLDKVKPKNFFINLNMALFDVINSS